TEQSHEAEKVQTEQSHEAEKVQTEQSDESDAIHDNESTADTMPSDAPENEAVEDETTSSASNAEEIIK
ncbi:MAG: hypothetical protein JRD01_13360, partial [Deltaproteobacteria bacterium]|nr:hypothetical protein [Deltaproteobacteria bacterium]